MQSFFICIYLVYADSITQHGFLYGISIGSPEIRWETNKTKTRPILKISSQLRHTKKTTIPTPNRISTGMLLAVAVAEQAAR